MLLVILGLYNYMLLLHLIYHQEKGPRSQKYLTLGIAMSNIALLIKSMHIKVPTGTVLSFNPTSRLMI